MYIMSIIRHNFISREREQIDSIYLLILMKQERGCFLVNGRTGHLRLVLSGIGVTVRTFFLHNNL